MAPSRQRSAPWPRVRARRSARAVAAGIALSLGGLVPGPPGLEPARAQPVARPNIVLILTDDQRFDTLHVMPAVRRFIADKGMTFRNAIVTNPLCCPSRATILTGRYSHSTGVYTNGDPDGGWAAFQPSEPSTIATALDEVDYRTALFGKYVNGYDEAGPHVPPGWDRWVGMSSPRNGAYYNYRSFDDRRGFVWHGSSPRDYSTDVLRRSATGFIRAAPTETPLFVMVAPFAPHSPFRAAERHEGAFTGHPVELGPGVNEADVSDKPDYVQALPRVSPSNMRSRIRQQWATLLAVNDLVSGIIDALRDTGRAENTIVIYTSDNGLLNGEHRWRGKQVPYEPSIRVPMLIRYPQEIAPGTSSTALVSNLDVAPTIADFAGVDLPADGVSLRPVLTGQVSSARDSVLLETVRWNNSVPTYCGVRVASSLFVRFGTGEEELYDLVQDPYQLRNVVSQRPTKANQLRSLTMSLCQPVPPGFAW